MCSDQETIASLNEAIADAVGRDPAGDEFRLADARQIISQHKAIVRAIRRHPRTAAERATREHIEYMGDVLRSVDGGS